MLSLTPANIVGDFVIQRHSDGWSTCEFSTRMRPMIGEEITVSTPEYGLLFRGRVNQTIVQFEQSDQNSPITKVSATNGDRVEEVVMRRWLI